MMTQRTRTVMALLGYSGLLPFYACALWLLIPGLPGEALAGRLFLVYGVVILAFLGGSLWGNAVIHPEPRKHARLIISNIVALFAALAGVAGSLFIGGLLLAVGQLALLLYERGSGDTRGWYLQFRTRLTLGVLPAHGLFAVGVAS